jgi:hypothetical protein
MADYLECLALFCIKVMNLAHSHAHIVHTGSVIRAEERLAVVVESQSDVYKSHMRVDYVRMEVAVFRFALRGPV